MGHLERVVKQKTTMNTIIVVLATLAVVYSQDLSCKDSYTQCRDAAIANKDVKAIFQCGKDYLKCRGKPLVDCAKECAKSLQTCRGSAQDLLERAQCWLEAARCGKECKPAPHDDDVSFDLPADFDDDLDDDTGCGASYKTCRDAAVLKFSVKAAFQCGIDYLKCRGGPALDCMKRCKGVAKQCLTDAGSNPLSTAQCFIDGLSCAKTCKIAPHDEIEEAYYDELDDGTDPTCSDTYKNCRVAAQDFPSVQDRALALGKCVKEFGQCKFTQIATPIAACIKQCHATTTTCAGKPSIGFLAKLQCYTEGGKCIINCRKATY